MKKKPPIEQLREAGKIAREMLIDKGVLSKDSIIDKIEKDDSAPKLPGLPSYIPRSWTINYSQLLMRNIIIQWMEKTKNDKMKRENISDFFIFVVKMMKSEEKKFKKSVNETSKIILSMKSNGGLLSEIFAPSRRLATTKVIHKFFVDSFAVSVIVKSNDSTSAYLEWFLDWTDMLKDTLYKYGIERKLKVTDNGKENSISIKKG